MSGWLLRHKKSAREDVVGNFERSCKVFCSGGMDAALGKVRRRQWIDAVQEAARQAQATLMSKLEEVGR